jgi:response regulator RpfG family c-di-GMP phosphodiesterase
MLDIERSTVEAPHLIRLLLVEDEPVSRLQLSRFLTDEGYCVIPLASGKEALNLLKMETFDAVIADFKLIGDVNGVDVLTRFESLTPGRCKILVTGYSPEQVGEKLIGTLYVSKPIKLDDLLLKLKSRLPVH